MEPTKTNNEELINLIQHAEVLDVLQRALPYWNLVLLNSVMDIDINKRPPGPAAILCIYDLINAPSVVPIIAAASLFPSPVRIKTCTKPVQIPSGGPRGLEFAADDAVSMAQYRKSVEESLPQSVSAADTAALL